MGEPRTRRALGGAALAAVLAGCGGPSGGVTVSQDPLADALAAAGTRAMPSALIGQWDVEAEGSEPGTVVNLDDREIEIFLACGSLDGSFAARPGGLFVGDVWGGSSDCFPDDRTIAETAPRWVEAASGFVVEGRRRLLLGTSGEVLATLTPAKRPPRIPNAEGEFVADPPDVRPDTRAAMDVEPAPLPAGLRPAMRADLLETWVLPDEPAAGWMAGEPSVTFEADGYYEGSDGCNGYGGRWATVNGLLLHTTGPSTLAGCDNVGLLDGAASAAMDGRVLVLLDHEGDEVRRLVRACDALPPTVPNGKRRQNCPPS